MKRMLWSLAVLAALAPAALAQPSAPKAALPEKFDLRERGGVTPIKAQSGGTCWAHGTMAALESNLLMSGMWKGMGLPGYPTLSEYHLDWWNGFNQHKNDDLADATADKTGLRVHQGGDYRVSAAYFSRGDGVVLIPRGADGAFDTKAWYPKAPSRDDATYKRLYVRDVEWFTMGDNLEGIEAIKRRVMTEGAMGTAYCVSKNFISKDFVHYQPLDSAAKPNHAVAIVGWDDTKVSADPDKKTPKPGAWLIKNSWGAKRGDGGYYWISYYDKVCCRDAEMGAVSFRNIEPMVYSQVYYHDYHGWRDTLKGINKAMNAFTATGRQQLRAVSIYTTADRVQYTVKIHRSFENGQLSNEVASRSGSYASAGFHTVNLDEPIWVEAKDKFYVSLEVSNSAQAIDRTSVIPVLLNQPDPKKEEKKDEKKEQPKKGPPKAFEPPTVISKAGPGESFYHVDGIWRDLQGHVFPNAAWNKTANFCIKALAVNVPDLVTAAPLPAITTPPTPPTPVPAPKTVTPDNKK